MTSWHPNLHMDHSTKKSYISGGWYTSPSEKYKFVSWDYEIPNYGTIKYVPNQPQHCTTHRVRLLQLEDPTFFFWDLNRCHFGKSPASARPSIPLCWPTEPVPPPGEWLWWMVSVGWWYHSRRCEKFLLGPCGTWDSREMQWKCRESVFVELWVGFKQHHFQWILGGKKLNMSMLHLGWAGGWKKSSKEQHSTGFIAQFGCYVSSKYWADHHWGCFIRHFLLVTAFVLQICCYEIFPNWFVWRIG